MDEQIIMDLITKVESQGLKIKALEDALVNLAGFDKVEADGSQQGLIKYSAPKPVVESKVGL